MKPIFQALEREKLERDTFLAVGEAYIIGIREREIRKGHISGGR